MTISIARRREIVLPLLAAILVPVLITTVWFAVQEDSPSMVMFIDMPVYESIEDLSAASDLVVRGTIGRVVGREIDYGTSDPAEKQGGGIPIVFHEVTVTETLRGASPSVIVVGVPDKSRITVAGHFPGLERNQQVLLFLNAETPHKAPGISILDHWYYPISLDNGIFDLVGNRTWKPRQSSLFAQNSYSFDEAREKATR